ncbi:hypothetical protein HY388_01570 [Candidatus Daviesbacteria bacterium]|nr:hypothetical protein [Candidatus Daviesbacteria bacterium]
MRLVDIAESVGTPIPGFWSQAVSVDPDDQKQRQKYGRLFLLVAIANGYGMDCVLLGRVLLEEITLSYYHTSRDSLLDAIADAFALARAKFDQSAKEHHPDQKQPPILSLGAIVVWSLPPKSKLKRNPDEPLDIVYLSTLGDVQIKISRGSKIKTIVGPTTGEVVKASGKIEQDDWLILATGSFATQLETVENLPDQLKGKNGLQVGDIFAPIIHGLDDSSQMAAIFIKIGNEDQAVTEDLVDEEEVDKPEDEQEVFSQDNLSISNQSSPGWLSRLPKPVDKFRLLKGRFWVNGDGASSADAFHRPNLNIALPTKDKSSQKKKLLLLVAVFCTGLLFLSILTAFSKRSLPIFQEQKSGIIVSVTAKYNEANNLLESNPKKMREILQSARQELSTASEKERKDEKFLNLKQQIDQLWLKAFNIFVEPPKIVIDLAKIQTATRAEQIFIAGPELLVFDKVNGQVLQTDKVGQKGSITVSLPVLKNATAAALFSGRLFTLDEAGISRLDLQKKTADRVIGRDNSWGQITAMATYEGNLYLFDSTKNQVWKYAAAATRFSSARSYIAKGQEVSLEDLADGAIDSAIWLLSLDGKITKLFSGKKEAFNQEPIDQAIANPRALFTSESTDNLYILDPAFKRVVVYNKKGEYLAQYQTDGLADGVDLAVDEQAKVIYVLTPTKILVLGLK